MTLSTLKWVRSSTALAVILTSGAAVAQDAPSAPSAANVQQESDSGLGDIIVTAQKRSQSIQDVGMTINVADSEVLARQGVVNVGDLTKVVSGFSAQVNGDGTPIFSIRGINFNAQNLAVSPTIAVSMDEAPLPYAVMAQGAILDLERVEVLKGPQGTLYGQNATGGTVNLIAAKPTDYLSYGGKVSYGRFETLETEGFVSGPLSDTLQARLALSATSSGPWQYSTSRPDDETGRQSKFAGRMLLNWAPTEKFHLSLNLNGWIDKSETLQPQVVNYRPANPAGTACEITPGCGFPADGPNPFVNIGKAREADWWPEFPTGRNNNFYQASVRADYDLTSNLQLTSLSTYSRVKIDSFFSGSGYPIPVQDQNFTGRIKAFNQELRVSGEIPDSGIHFIVGASYAYDKSNQVDHWFDELNSATAPAFTLFDNITNQKGKSYAAFASMDWDITDRLSLSAGIRYTDSKRTATSCTHDVDGAAAATFNFLIDGYRKITMSTFQDRVSTEAPQSKRDIARERRREAIIQKAAALFYRYGYGSTTMTMVANAVGGSKGTLWSYFGTKELLLTAVVDGASAEFHDAIRSAFRPSDDVRNSTIDLCRIATERMLEPDISGLFRIVVTEGQNHREIKTIFYDRGPRFVRLCLTEYLTCAIGPTESERIAPQILSLVMGYRLRCIFEPELRTSAAISDFFTEIIPVLLAKKADRNWR